VFARRGIVPEVADFALPGLEHRIIEAGLNTVGFHGGGGAEATPQSTIDFITGERGRTVLHAFADAGVDIEYELHAMRWLLPRGLFDGSPELFRMDETGARTPDANLCCSSSEALRIVSRRAVQLCRILRSTTHRYFLWADDGQPWCRCPQCRGLSPSDQNLIITNAIAGALREWDPHAKLAALTYLDTLEPPRQVKPAPNVFLEFAPIRRDSSRALTHPGSEANAEMVAACEAAVDFFGSQSAHVLEYWIDVSRASGWKRPAAKLPYDGAVLRKDLRFYETLGFESVTSFSCWIDADYVRRWGDPPLDEYAAALRGD